MYAHNRAMQEEEEHTGEQEQKEEEEGEGEEEEEEEDGWVRETNCCNCCQHNDIILRI